MNIPQPSRNFLGVNLDDVICVGDWDSGHFMLCTYVFEFNVVNCVFYLYSVLTDTICFIPFLKLSRTGDWSSAGAPTSAQAARYHYLDHYLDQFDQTRASLGSLLHQMWTPPELEHKLDIDLLPWGGVPTLVRLTE